MGLFDNPWHILIVLLVLVLLFGSAKLPKAAKSMGEAMRIFKKEAQKLHDDDDTPPQAQLHAGQPQQLVTPAQPVFQQPVAQQPVVQQPVVQQPVQPQPVVPQPPAPQPVAPQQPGQPGQPG